MLQRYLIKMVLFELFSDFLSNDFFPIVTKKGWLLKKKRKDGLIERIADLPNTGGKGQNLVCFFSKYRKK